MNKYEFPWPDMNKGYCLFPKELEDNPNVLFHGTAIKNFDSIVQNGFKSAKELGKGTDRNILVESVTYCHSSDQVLNYVYGLRERSADSEFVVFAVRFETLDLPQIKDQGALIWVYGGIQPEKVGYCNVPTDYLFI